MTNILSKILKSCRLRLEDDKKILPHPTLLDHIKNPPPTRSFAQALTQKKISIIAEVKKKSPSQGLLADPFDPLSLAQSYQKNGAACLSILCERDWFDGHPQHLSDIRQVTHIPLMRKDFIFDHYQIDHSRFIGADAILLILSLLNDTLARELEDHALSLNLDVLIETHNPEELTRALTMKSHLIGINNRNLNTLSLDNHTALSLAQDIPPHILLIAESGFHSADDLRPYLRAGISSFLIGTHFMRSPNPGLALSSLLKELS